MGNDKIMNYSIWDFEFQQKRYRLDEINFLELCLTTLLSLNIKHVYEHKI